MKGVQAKKANVWVLDPLYVAMLICFKIHLIFLTPSEFDPKVNFQ